MKKTRLLLLLALLMTAATGAWAQDAKHLITATYDKQTRSLEQPLPYETTVGALYEAVTGQSFNDFISFMSAAYELNLTGISSGSPSVVLIGDFNGASTKVKVNADGKATVALRFGNFAQGIYVSVVPPLYVTMADGTKDAAKWTATVGTNSTANPLPVGGLSEKDAVTLTYGGRLKVKGVTATTDYDPLATPLTVEALTAGTIVVKITDEDDDPVTLQSGMKYSKDGGKTKTLITESEDIPVAKGDKVQFYGNGTDTQVYGNYPMVSILGDGDGFQTKVYGNIMSLLDETGFATNTELPNAEDAENVFYELFAGNTTLIDASELLLPAAKMAYGCYEYMFERCTNLTMAPKLPAETLAENCYEGMFLRCSSLTTAPKLPATTLATKCYSDMFRDCTSLTNAYVKAAYTVENNGCRNMFKGCKADGAVLHTTPGSKESWEAKMGSGKEWPTWSVAADWQD